MVSRFTKCLSILLLSGVGAATSAPGLNIRIRYDHHGGMFPPGSEARVAMRAVCDFYEEVITDRLGAIDALQIWQEYNVGVTWRAIYRDPSTGRDRTFTAPDGNPNIIIAEDDFYLFVGSRNFPGIIAGEGGGTGFSGATDFGPWLNAIRARGQAGALGRATSQSDYGPWGGVVSFDRDRTWDFSLDGRGTSGGTSFVSVALHEVAHALGFGVANSYYNYVSSSGFRGPNARLAYQNANGPRNVPLNGADVAHLWDDGAGTCTEPGGFGSDGVPNTLSRTLPIFGTPRGRTQQVLMDASTCGAARYHPVMTSVDMAILEDVGWNIIEQVDLESLGLEIGKSQTSPPSLTFRTQEDYTYQLQRSENLLVWDDIGAPADGDGGTITLTDDDPPASSCCYRIAILRPQAPPAAQALAAPLAPPPAVPPGTVSSPPARVCDNCEFHVHDHE